MAGGSATWPGVFADAFAEPLAKANWAAELLRLVERLLAGLPAGEPKKLLDVPNPAFAVHADAAVAPGGVSSELVGAQAWAKRAVEAARGAARAAGDG